MSIEPTSVSKPVMRESETGSSNRWNFLQGSGTGTTEGQFSSFWDKTVHGAQKLLGIETKQEEELEEGASRENKGEAKPQGNGGRLGSTPGFGNSGFGSIAHNVRRESMNDVRFGQTDRSFESVDTAPTDYSDSDADLADLNSSPKEKSELAPKEKREAEEKPQTELKEKAEVPAEEEDEEDEAKSAAPTPETVLPLMQKRPEGNLLSTDQQSLKGEAKGVGATGAQNSPEMVPLTKESASPITAEKSPLTELGTPLKQNAAKAEATIVPMTPAGTKVPQAKESAPSEFAAPIAQTTSKSVQTPVVDGKAAEKHATTSPASLRAMTANEAEAKKALSAMNQQGAQVVSKEAKAESESKSEGNVLSFDAEKAKAEVSNALRRSSRPVPVQQSPQTKAPQQASAANKPVGEGQPAPAAQSQKQDAASDIVEFKSAQTPQVSQVKTPASQARAQAANAAEAAKQSTAAAQGASQSESATTASAQRSASHAVDTQNVVAKSSEGRTQPIVPRAKPVSAPATQGISNTGGLQAAGGMKMNAGSGSESQSNGQNAQSDTGAKQDAAAAVKQSANAAMAKADKGSGEGQSFSVQSSSETSSRRSQAAEKAAPTTYSSKSAEEVKETFQVLSKGIEKMIASKQSTFTVKINFDQGGMMSLKVSMENGKVNSQMQTDLPGLEGMIKQNWSELASDWNAKGVKLNVPQFSSGSESGDSRSENFMSFDQREARNQAANGGGQGRGANAQNKGKGASENGSGRGQEGADTQNAESDEVISDSELKTYA